VARVSLSMLPQLMTHTMVFASRVPWRAAATGAAPAPSATRRLRSASSRTAAATSATEATSDPASRSAASGHMSANTFLPPIPSTKLGVDVMVTDASAASAAANGAEVSTSAA
jgi:hypothetical protein